MKVLKEINFDKDITLCDNLVKGAILPKFSSELIRNVMVQRDSTIEGAVYANKLEIQSGDVEFQGAILTKLELHIDSGAKGSIYFRKTVASMDSLFSMGHNVKLLFFSDINAKSVKLSNAFISGSIFAEEVILEHCVVLGGVFATKSMHLSNSIVGTFNSQSVSIQENIGLLLPSAFSVEPLHIIGNARMINYTLADLGSAYVGAQQLPNSGIIDMNIEEEELKSVLDSDVQQMLLRTYSVVGKVLAADMVDTEKFNNHFLIAATSLGNQLLQTYTIPNREENTLIDIVPDKVASMFFDILDGRIEIQKLDGSFKIDDLSEKFTK